METVTHFPDRPPRTEVQINSAVDPIEAWSALAPVLVRAAGPSLTPISTGDPRRFLVRVSRSSLEAAASIECPERIASLQFAFFDPED